MIDQTAPIAIAGKPRPEAVSYSSWTRALAALSVVATAIVLTAHAIVGVSMDVIVGTATLIALSLIAMFQSGARDWAIRALETLRGDTEARVYVVSHRVGENKRSIDALRGHVLEARLELADARKEIRALTQALADLTHVVADLAPRIEDYGDEREAAGRIAGPEPVRGIAQVYPFRPSTG